MTDSIHQEVNFKAKPSEVYAALMETKRHMAFTKNGVAKVSKKVGGAFLAHGGWVSGINLEEGKRIVQAWRGSDWPQGIYSIVSFKFSKDGKGTKLVFDHTGIPDGKAEHLATGWKKMYWDPMAEYFLK